MLRDPVHGPSQIRTVSAAIYRELNFFITRGPEEVWPIVVSKLEDIGTDIPGGVGPAVEAQLFATARI